MLCPCLATLNQSEISVGQDDLNPGTNPAAAGSYMSQKLPGSLPAVMYQKLTLASTPMVRGSDQGAVVEVKPVRDDPPTPITKSR